MRSITTSALKARVRPFSPVLIRCAALAIQTVVILTLPSCGQHARVSDALPGSVAKEIRDRYQSTGSETRYFDAWADLDGDGKYEAIVHVVSPTACGTGGCPTMIFRQSGSGDYEPVADIAITRPPIQMSASTVRGWRSLIVRVAGGGGPSFDAELEFDGAGYPSNPSIPPARKVENLTGAKVLIEQFESLQDGKILSGI